MIGFVKLKFLVTVGFDDFDKHRAEFLTVFKTNLSCARLIELMRQEISHRGNLLFP